MVGKHCSRSISRERFLYQPFLPGHITLHYSCRCATLPATKRVRDSESTEKSKPASVNSQPGTYFQSIRARTASAACQSQTPSAKCITVTTASCQGVLTGRCRITNRDAKNAFFAECAEHVAHLPHSMALCEKPLAPYAVSSETRSIGSGFRDIVDIQR